MNNSTIRRQNACSVDLNKQKQKFQGVKTLKKIISEKTVSV